MVRWTVSSFTIPYKHAAILTNSWIEHNAYHMCTITMNLSGYIARPDALSDVPANNDDQ